MHVAPSQLVLHQPSRWTAARHITAARHTPLLPAQPLFRRSAWGAQRCSRPPESLHVRRTGQSRRTTVTAVAAASLAPLLRPAGAMFLQPWNLKSIPSASARSSSSQEDIQAHLDRSCCSRAFDCCLGVLQLKQSSSYRVHVGVCAVGQSVLGLLQTALHLFLQAWPQSLGRGQRRTPHSHQCVIHSRASCIAF